MYCRKKILGIIPARGGSKGVPRKNIKLLAGKPLIVWTIEEAQKSGVIDKLIVSTDDEEIAEVAREYGAEVPFMRPPELATDEAKGIDVVLHAMNWYEEKGENFDLVILLQPTSPLRKAEDILGALKTFIEKKAGAVVSVCECEHSPLWMNTLGEDLRMNDFLPKEAFNKNRQELKKFYRLNGAVYVAEWEYLRGHKGFFGEDTFAYIMTNEKSIDIDKIIDFKIAEAILNKYK